GGFVAAYDSFPAADKALLGALRRYAAAQTPAARAAVLVEEIVTSTQARIAFDAAFELADDPAALVAVTPADRDRLLAKLPDVPPDSQLSIALARLGVPASQLAGTAAELAKEHTFEAVTKPEALADILAAIPDGESARGAAAFERCERLRGRRLNDIRDTLSRNVWHQLAAQCRAAH
nr:hypothetical protein [Deltaproteobacteria bacterium]